MYVKHSSWVRLSTRFEAVTIGANFTAVISVNRKSSLICVVLFLYTWPFIYSFPPSNSLFSNTPGGVTYILRNSHQSHCFCKMKYGGESRNDSHNCCHKLWKNVITQTLVVCWNSTSSEVNYRYLYISEWFWYRSLPFCHRA